MCHSLALVTATVAKCTKVEQEQLDNAWPWAAVKDPFCAAFATLIRMRSSCMTGESLIHVLLGRHRRGCGSA